MFLIEDHHRETIKRVMENLYDSDQPEFADELYEILSNFIPYKPDLGLTDQQLSKLWRKWRQSDQGMSFSKFMAGVQPLSFDDAITVQWCGMWLCIETDGECHT